MEKLNENKESKGSKKNVCKYVKKGIGILYIIVLGILFFSNNQMYMEKEEILYGRIVVVLFVLVVMGTLLFLRNKWSDKMNQWISVIYWCACVPVFFAVIEYSQGFEVLRLSFLDLKYNLFIIFTVMLVFLAITGRSRYSIILSAISACALGLGNFYLIRFRGTGLLASDLYNVKTAANVAGNYDYTLNYNCFVLVLIASLIVYIALFIKKVEYIGIKKHAVLLVAGIAVAVFTLNKFVYSEANIKYLKIKMFKPQVTYQIHGCSLIFLHSFRYNIIEKPEDYSVEKTKEIASQYTGTKTENQKQPNIIVIMNEAFADLQQVGEMNLSEDCMPFYHSLSENSIKGKLFVSVFAGGTANTEFEVLTSNALAFTPLKSSPYQIYINREMPSLATILRNQGYGGMIAMHPYKGNGYKRDKVYPLLGFDTFLTEDDFVEPELVRNHVSDKEDFKRIITEYENYRKTNDNPFFLFNVTMQNHSAYDEKWDNLQENITIDPPLNNAKTQTYINLIKKSDEALEYLVDYYKTVDEPTIVVMFGDHQPRLGTKFYNKLLSDSKIDSEYKELEKYFTPFVIWANYDIEEQKDVWTSGNYMATMILEAAGLSKTGYQQYLSEIQKEVPVITQLGYIGSDGKFYENDDTSSPYYNKLQEYNILEYNNLFDSKNRIEGFFEE